MAKRAPAAKRSPNPLKPARSIFLVEGKNVFELAPEDAIVSRIGHKAFGLASIPINWTKPYFVVSGDKKPTTTALVSALQKCGIPKNSKLLVRSSGVDESIENRGEHPSSECAYNQLTKKIAELTVLVDRDSSVHWVVQELVPCVEKGQLANERRVAKDKRDWVAEIEATTAHPTEIHRISLRTWRDNRKPQDISLSCSHRESIIGNLAIAARWTYERLIRVHFEWVWDGHDVYIVQADPCDAVSQGTNPHDLITKASVRSPDPALEVFRLASEADFQSYRKLANVKVYSQLGYKVSPFYVLENENEIKLIVQHGRCSDALQRDLAQLGPVQFFV